MLEGCQNTTIIIIIITIIIYTNVKTFGDSKASIHISTEFPIYTLLLGQSASKYKPTENTRAQNHRSVNGHLKVRSQVFTAVTMKNAVFCDVAPRISY
jgi:hypothetical protein